MGSFSIWHWLIIAALVGLVAWLVLRSKGTAPINREQPKGIGGWLRLLAFGQVLAVLRTIATFGQNMEGYGQIRDIPNGQAVIYSETGLNMLLLLVTVATAYALFAKKSYFCRLYLRQWLTCPVVFAIDYLVVSALLSVPVSLLIDTTRVVITFALFLAGAIWVWYIQVSVRVRNTMVN